MTPLWWMRGLRAAVLALPISLCVLFGGTAGASAAELAGKVTRLKESVAVVWGSGRQPLAVDATVFIGDTIETGAGARVEMAMVDGSTITLGEHAVFIIEDYLFDRAARRGSALMRVVEGAFRTVTGVLAGFSGEPFVVRTPVATIGIRGTDFWGGPLDGVYNIALLGGAAIFVENAAGRVDITEIGTGTTVEGPNIAPTPPVGWDPAKIQQATDTINF